MQTENEAYAWLLYNHLGTLIHRLRQIPADKWDWQPAVCAPSARLLAQHAWAWLICDRQHLEEPDATLHSPIPEPANEQTALCDALVVEAGHWQTLILGLTPEHFLEPRKQFALYPMNVRNFVCHILQSTIYRNGQLATIYYALGLDGIQPYVAPMPNDAYHELADVITRPLLAAVLKANASTVQTLLGQGADVNQRDGRGVTALMYSAWQGDTAILHLLLTNGADLNARDHNGDTALAYAKSYQQSAAQEILTQADADE